MRPFWAHFFNAKLQRKCLMFFSAYNGSVALDDTTMDYVRFGRGEKNLIILPGLGDGLVTVKGKALMMAASYGKVTKGYTVYMFSRRNHLPENFTLDQSAADLAIAMEKLGMDRADVIGISQGGMIAQKLALLYPGKIGKLVLGVTTAAAGQHLKEAVSLWMDYARKGDYKNLMIDTAERTYTEKQLKSYRKLYPILTRVGKPKSFSRFLTLAQCCIDHDTRQRLKNLTCPVLVIGGGADKIVGPDASKELHELIPGSRLILYPDLGHGAYEEAPDFFPKIMEFLKG